MKMMKKTCLALLLLVAVLLFAGCEKEPVEELPTWVNTASCTCRVLSADTAALVKWYGGEREVTIPAAVEGYTVVTLEGLAISNRDSLVSLVLPDTMKTLHTWSIMDCENLKTITVPASVTEIQRNAINECPNVTLIVTRGSAAEGYAQANGIPYEVR